MVSAANERIAKTQIARDLAVGERVFRRLLAQNSERLAQAASVLAADFAFREAIATRDEGTIVSVLGNYGRRINASVSMGTWTQDAPFYPYTHNTALNTPAGLSAASYGALQQKSYGGEVNTTMLNLSFASRLRRHLRVR